MGINPHRKGYKDTHGIGFDTNWICIQVYL